MDVKLYMELAGNPVLVAAEEIEAIEEQEPLREGGKVYCAVVTRSGGRYITEGTLEEVGHVLVGTLMAAR